MQTPALFADSATAKFDIDFGADKYKNLKLGIDTNRKTTPLLIEGFLKPYLAEDLDSSYGALDGGGDLDNRSGVSQCFIEIILQSLLETQITETPTTGSAKIEAPDCIMALLMALAARAQQLPVAERIAKKAANIDSLSFLDNRIF